MKLAVQFGAGGIGRGFLGQLLSESDYQVIFVDVDAELIDALNQQGSYPLQLVGDRNETLTISNISALKATQSDAVADALARADFICTASGVRALPPISKLLALGLQKRCEITKAPPVNIVICENLKQAATYLRELVQKHPNCPPSDYLDKSVGFVQSVVARMVPVRTPETLAQDPLLVVAEAYPFLPIDAAAIRGQAPQVKGLILADEFQGYVERKLFVHNAMHAMCAYMGYRAGLKYVWQAASDTQIQTIVLDAMSSVCRVLSKKHNLDPVGLAENVYDLLRRFRCKALGDTIQRVAGDPIRKLSGPGGRLIGPARLCLAENIIPDGIIHAIALALGYDNPADESAVRLQAMIADRGPEAVINEICGVAPDEKLGQLILDKYEKNTPTSPKDPNKA